MVQPQQTHRPPMRAVLEAYVNVTAASYTAKAGDRVIGVNRAGAVTVTLPTAEVRKGRIYTVKDESGAAATNNITVATEGSETIDGSATDVINVNYESKSYYSDGTNWFILPITPDTNTQNSYEAPGLTLGTANAEGTGNSIRSGATIAAFDTTLPVTQAHSDAAATGTAAKAARRDHKHGMPAGGSGSDISARVHNSANQSIPNNAATALAMDSERFDTDSMHDNVTNNSRLTCKTAGVYIITGHFRWAGNATGGRSIAIHFNGSTKIANLHHGDVGANFLDMAIATIWKLAVNDRVELMAYQNSGGSLDVQFETSWGMEFAMAKILG